MTNEPVSTALLQQFSPLDGLKRDNLAALARKVQELQEVRSRFFEALRKALGDRSDIKDAEAIIQRLDGEGAVTGGGALLRAGDKVKQKIKRIAAHMLEASADALAALITDPETWAPARDLRPDSIGGVPLRKS